MFLATLGGSVVTKTESGLGCGNDWPLCHGKFVPAHTLASMIEYSHRAVSGAAGLVSLAAFVAFWLYRKNRKDLQIYSLLALIFVMVQAVMGAMAVIYPTSSAVMALHFGFSLIAFASSIMLVLGVRQEERGQVNAQSSDYAPSSARVSKAFRNLTWIATGYTYIVVYIGAYVSHTDSAGGCSGWPLCNGQLVPELSGGRHRLSAPGCGRFAAGRNSHGRSLCLPQASRSAGNPQAGCRRNAAGDRPGVHRGHHCADLKQLRCLFVRFARAHYRIGRFIRSPLLFKRPDLAVEPNTRGTGDVGRQGGLTTRLS